MLRREGAGETPTPANSNRDTQRSPRRKERTTRGEPDRVLSISRRFSGIVPRSGTVGGTRTRTTSLHHPADPRPRRGATHLFEHAILSFPSPGSRSSPSSPLSINSYNSRFSQPPIIHRSLSNVPTYRIEARHFSSRGMTGKKRRRGRSIAYRPFVSKVCPSLTGISRSPRKTYT